MRNQFRSRSRDVRVGLFAAALRGVLARKGLTAAELAKRIGLSRPDLIKLWIKGAHVPSAHSFPTLTKIEAAYGLRAGYLVDRAKLVRRRASRPVPALGRFKPAQVRLPDVLLRWHLPDNYESLDAKAWSELAAWLVETFGCEDQHRPRGERRRSVYGFDLHRHIGIVDPMDTEMGVPRFTAPKSRPSPPKLVEEWRDLLDFQTTPMTRPGYSRSRTWGIRTIKVYAAMLGCSFVDLLSAMNTNGRPSQMQPGLLSLGLLAFPRAWDHILRIGQARRGGVSETDRHVLTLGLALTNPRTGWLAQTPQIVEALRPVQGILREEERLAALADWAEHCRKLYADLNTRRRDLSRMEYPTRDPTADVAVVLQDPNPLHMYAKIARNIWRHRPDPDGDPTAAAKYLRDYIAIRIGMHTGLRSFNISQLRLNLSARPATDRDLAQLRVGEIRRAAVGAGWEVYVPRPAFKSPGKLYRKLAFRVVLPDVDGLYGALEDYVGSARNVLLGDGPDPGWLFVHPRGTQGHLISPAVFHKAWRAMIIRYGIYNPWTGRGVVEGLRPHGPHAVRSIVATQVLKTTGSVTLAAYAIQDHPLTVEKYYLRYVHGGTQAMLGATFAYLWKGHEGSGLPALALDRPDEPEFGPAGFRHRRLA